MGGGSAPSLRLAPRSIASHHRDSGMTLADQQACADVIQAWSFARDQGRWSDLLATFAPEGEIAVSWFRGPFEKFVERCRQSFSAGVRSKHLVWPPLVRVNGDRAVAETSIRSEEHTSELQSLRHLVCRL